MIKLQTVKIELQGIHQRLESFADFPSAKLFALAKTLPATGFDLPAIICLLPAEEPLNDEALDYAAAITAMTMSVFIHDEAAKRRCFSSEEAVLYGDYLFAIAFSLLPLTIKAENGATAVSAYKEFNEQRQKHIPVTAENLKKVAATDYGRTLSRIAQTATEGQRRPYANAYKEAAFALGTVWGMSCEAPTADMSKQIAHARVSFASLPMAESFNDLLNEVTGEAR